MTPTLGDSSFSLRNSDGPSGGKIIQVSLSTANAQIELAVGTHVTVSLGSEAGRISLDSHPDSAVFPCDRKTGRCDQAVELVLISNARVNEGLVVEPVRAVFANDRDSSLIRYENGGQAIVSNKLGMTVVIEPGSLITQTPQRLMSEAA